MIDSGKMGSTDNDRKTSRFSFITARRNLSDGLRWTVIWLAPAACLSLFLQPGTLATKEAVSDEALKRGFDELQKGDNQEALKYFRAKMTKYPASGACHTGLGRSLKSLGKISEAKEEFRQATLVDPAYADGFYELGAALEADKDWQGAAAAFQRYLELKPDAGQRQAISDRISYCRGQK